MTSTNSAITEEWLTQTLTELGNNADKVATSLRDAEVKGRRNNAAQCPVARYIARRVVERVPSTRLQIDILSDTAVITAPKPNADVDDVIVTVELPDSILAFIQRFDQGDYPDLVEN